MKTAKVLYEDGREIELEIDGVKTVVICHDADTEGVASIPEEVQDASEPVAEVKIDLPEDIGPVEVVEATESIESGTLTIDAVDTENTTVTTSNVAEEEKPAEDEATIGAEEPAGEGESVIDEIVNLVTSDTPESVPEEEDEGEPVPVQEPVEAEGPVAPEKPKEEEPKVPDTGFVGA